MAPATARMSAEERRADLLRAAVESFATGGYAGTSTEAIASRAGISQPYLFRLFSTKKALFLAVLDHCWQTVHAAFETAAGDRTGEEAFAAMGDAYGELLENRSWLLVQMVGYAACDDPDIRATMRRG